MTRRKLLFALIPAIVAGGLTPAQAGEFRFAYQDYQLKTAEGRRILLHTLEKKAKRYCRSGRPVYRVRVAQACQAEIKSEVVRQIDDGGLTALYDSYDRVAANNAK